jgi:threonine/homoserine/homoserine lactone efflux protein
MGELFVLFITSFGIAFSGAVMPGPLLSATIGESPRSGTRTGPLFMLGHGLLEAALVAALLAGLGPFLNLPVVTGVVSLGGALIMLWMAYGMFKSLPTLSIPEAAAPDRGIAAAARLPVNGVLLSLANPYWSIWWLTIGLGLILRSQPLGAAGILAFFIGHLTGDFLWYTSVSFAVSRGKRLLTPRGYRVLIGVCALAIAVFGILFFKTGVSVFISASV